MSNSRSNFPPNKVNEMSAASVHEIVSNVRQLYNLGQPKDVEECKQRIDDFFELCERTSLRPGVESLAMALHVSRQTLSNWEHGKGCEPEQTVLIRNAKCFINAFLEQASLSGKLNPATSIFLLKNWAGYRDTVVYETQSNELLPSERAEIIAQRRHLLGGDTMPEKPL